jgi:hypothetical protein
MIDATDTTATDDKRDQRLFDLEESRHGAKGWAAHGQ